MTLKWVTLFAVHIAIYVGAYVMLAKGLSCVSFFEPSSCSDAEKDLQMWGFYAGLLNLLWSVYWLYLALRLLVRGIRHVLNQRNG